MAKNQFLGPPCESPPIPWKSSPSFWGIYKGESRKPQQWLPFSKRRFASPLHCPLSAVLLGRLPTNPIRIPFNPVFPRRQEEGSMQIDPELEAIKARVKEMEEEAEKIKQMQSEVDKQMAGGSTTGLATVPLSLEEKQEIDTRSVYVGNVDYGASAEELEAHFHGCGTINRVTILCNKADGHPKGFAYIEFGSKESVLCLEYLNVVFKIPEY